VFVLCYCSYLRINYFKHFLFSSPIGAVVLTRPGPLVLYCSTKYRRVGPSSEDEGSLRSCYLVPLLTQHANISLHITTVQVRVDVFLMGMARRKDFAKEMKEVIIIIFLHPR